MYFKVFKYLGIWEYTLNSSLAEVQQPAQMLEYELKKNKTTNLPIFILNTHLKLTVADSCFLNYAMTYILSVKIS